MGQHLKVSNEPDRSRGVKRVSWVKLRYIGLALVVLWAAYEFWYVQAPELTLLNQQHAELQSQLTALQHQQHALNGQVLELQSDQYIAKYATSHYNLIVPGQVSFDLGH
jgi:cell division protein FtsB